MTSSNAGLIDRICHKEQIGIWADEIVSALALSDFLREEWTFDDTVDLGREIQAQLRDVIGSALTHPEFNILEALSASQARVKVLEEALTPFANEAFMYDPPEDDDAATAWNSKFHIGLFRRARNALKSEGEI